ncbi:MAG TPA: hypothetical protein VJH22_01090 [Candidatus Nanoarchaeia archaeon]|nr:hypothetical protein [Candidatus Nanoarchaeia archaeon]
MSEFDFEDLSKYLRKGKRPLYPEVLEFLIGDTTKQVPDLKKSADREQCPKIIVHPNMDLENSLQGFSAPLSIASAHHR